MTIVDHSDVLILPDLRTLLRSASVAAETLVDDARLPVSLLVSINGKIDRNAVDREQHAVHGFAWYATYSETFREVANWADRLAEESKFGEIESLLSQLLIGEYAAQMIGGIAMNQGEIIRPAQMGVTSEQVVKFQTPAILTLIQRGATQAVKSRVAELLVQSKGRPILEASGLEDTFEMIRDQFHAFAEAKITPFAHQWHLNNDLIPIELVEELGDLGVFGLTVPEEYGGLGMGKMAMCVVSEELSRAYIGVGSLGTRSEIAAELILTGGTEAQKNYWLPKIASAEILPTAVFTEPNTGSDLGALRTRAALDGDNYVVTGNKTWITHAVRADVMTMLVRTDPNTSDYRGLSMFLAPKLRGDDHTYFPTEGISGGEIEVLGYRGMREYEMAFDGFKVPVENLLGGVEGQGFKQLMATFEGARIQTAARAVGVAQNAMEIALGYALDRKQFGQSIFEFPRVYNKLAMMAAEIMGVRQLTYFAARAKDDGKRCDLEAGMAKLLAARVAWASADNALQIHGGNGFALEYSISRVLQDARILNIFEGAGEIQAQVIARRLLEDRTT